MKKNIIIVIISLLFAGGMIYAAPSLTFHRTLLPETDSLFEIGTHTQRWLNVWADFLHSSSTIFDYTTTTYLGVTSMGGGGGDVKVSADGSLYEGTDATGAGTGGAGLWSYDTNAIFNSTTTNAVGVGSTTPWGKFSVHSTVDDDSTAGPIFVISSSTASATSTHFIVQRNGNVGIGTTSPNSLFQVSRGSGGTEDLMKIGTSTDDDMFVVKSDGEVHILSGSVGIGTNAPAQELEVVGDIRLSGAARRIENSTSDLDLYSQADIRFYPSNTYAGRWRGNALAIGDATPDAHLEVSADGGSGGAVFMASSDDNNDGDLFIVQESGNVGIGTSTPAYNLVVNGTTNPFFQIASSTNQQLLIMDANGNVGINTSTPALNAKLGVNGDVYIGGALTIEDRVTSTEQMFVEGERVTGWKGGGFSVSSSTLSVEGDFGATGTTTLKLPQALENEKWNKIYCSTSGTTGTTTIRVGDGSVWMEFLECPRYQADNLISLSPSSNNTFTEGEQLQIEIGHKAGDPDRVNISWKKEILAD